MEHSIAIPYLTINNQQNMLSSIDVTVPAPFVQAVFEQAARSQQQMITAQGFDLGSVPLNYIKTNFYNSLIEHTKEFLFKYCVIDTLYRDIRAQQLLIAGEPRLADIQLTPDHDAHFIFTCTVFPSLQLLEWKYFPFKAPKRKNYKDLDRQVEAFTAEEKQRYEQYADEGITIGDWLLLRLNLVNEHNQPLATNHTVGLWVKMGDEEADSDLRELFLGKKRGDLFYTNNNTALQNYFSDQLNAFYRFQVEIIEVISYAYFCFEFFKHHFKLKTNKEMFQKLIETFSYRNDLSQRRAMVEEALKLLVSRHKFDVPHHLILRQQKRVLDHIQQNPDYQVYRVQKDFNDHLAHLAEKQVKEMLIIDQISYDEHLTINDHDIKSYLNLTKRPRTKEFIYFDMPNTKPYGQELPISAEELKYVCLREKTLNHIIYHLVRK